MSIDTPMTGDLPLDICEGHAKASLAAFIELFGTKRPSLRQVWAAMDFVWDSISADNQNPSPDHLAKFYSHPVWLLNGLFVEQDADSLYYRRAFANWASSVNPHRVADFGGGFGTLARMIGEAIPAASVEIVDPFPRPEAICANAGIANVVFADALSGTYDLIVATDVFEHVEDPIGLFLKVAEHIPIGGYALIANHFAPSVKCHLPCTFHLELTWDIIMQLAGFVNASQVHYGTVWRRVAPPRGEPVIRWIEALSRSTYRLSKTIQWSTRARRILFRKIVSRLIQP